MRYKILGLLFTFFCLFNPIFSTNYAEVSFLINSQGDVLISGIDSGNEFILNTQTPKYTSKRGEVWTLNITSEKVYETFIFDSTFPKGAQINYIKTTPNFRIDEDLGNLKIIGTGENKPITLIVQYEIKKESEVNSNYLISFLVLLFGFLIGFLIRNKVFSRKNNKIKNLKYENLNERQKDIIKILEKEDTITQKKIEEILQIPKAAISRNIKTLEIRGFIKKERIGNTNYISLLK